MRDRIFIGIFSAFLLLVLVSAPAKMLLTEAGLLRSDNVGNVITVDKVYPEDSFGAPLFNAIEEGKREINDIYTNYIPFYVDITAAASRIRLSLNEPVTSFLLNSGNRILLEAMQTPETDIATETDALSETDTETGKSAETTGDTAAETRQETEEKPFEPVKKAVYRKGDSNHRYYEIIVQNTEEAQPIDFFVRVPAKDAAMLQDTMQSQAAAINDLASRVPEVNWYVFPVTCFEDTVLCDTLLPGESKRGLFQEFLALLDEGVQSDYLKVETFEDKNTLYFRTDHHWNAYGQAEAYRLIAEMFRVNYPELEIREPVIHTFDDKVQMYGSNALALADYTMYDTFHAADFSLPAHTAVQDTGVPYGGTNALDVSFETYLGGTYSKDRGFNHYMNFYRILKEVEYPENRTGRNLLIIGDSYSPPLMEVLASHFDRTYIRYVDSNEGLPDMLYEDIIKQYGITDVLMLEISCRVVYDYYGDSLKNIR